MTNRPKRHWLLRSLLGSIVALLAWIVFPWFHDSRLIWSIQKPLETFGDLHHPAVICADPHGRWIFVKHSRKKNPNNVCTVLRQDNGEIVYEIENEHVVPFPHTDVNQAGEIIYQAIKFNDSKVVESDTPSNKLVGWLIIKAWNLNNGSDSEKMRIPFKQHERVKLSAEGDILVSYAEKEADLEVKVWSTSNGQCLRSFVITNANLDDPVLVSSNCRWFLMGKKGAVIYRSRPGAVPDLAYEAEQLRIGLTYIVREERGLRAFDLANGRETEEIKKPRQRTLTATLLNDLVVLGLSKSLSAPIEECAYIDLSMADRSLKPYPSHFYRPSISNHYGLITPLSFHRWIELNSVIDHPVVPNPAATLHRIDLDGGHPNEYPFFPFPDIRQSSPHGNSEIIVNHQKPGEVPSWLVPWLTKYDLMNYWPWSACKRIVICEAETGKEVWQKRFPVDGYLQADMSRDQSKLFVLYWKKDQLELYAYSLDFSCRSYWQQSCAALAVFAFFLFFRWPKRKKSGCVPVQPVA